MFSIWSVPKLQKESIVEAGLHWREPAVTVNYDPSSRQRGLYEITNPQLSK
jgi:hypothetical protein